MPKNTDQKLAMEEAEKDLLRSMNSAQLGPEAKEINLLHADEAYRNGNVEHSIYYQVKAQFQGTDTRYITESESAEEQKPSLEEILSEFNDMERAEAKDNKFLQHIISALKQSAQREVNEAKTMAEAQTQANVDFLEDIVEPAAGLARISEICHQLPAEWCVLQVCKSFNAATSYCKFDEIFGADGVLYVALLRHCRSPELGATCLRFHGEQLTDLFKQYSTLSERFKSVISVDPKNYRSQEAKQKYWQQLNAFELFMQELLDNFRHVLAPYAFLLLGKRYDSSAMRQLAKSVYRRVDEFCQQRNWSTHQRILLSQAALHANNLNELELACFEIAAGDVTESQEANELLRGCAKDWRQLELQQTLSAQRYPSILIVDERLDHLHWEQLAPTQEFTRFKSLHSLWRLYRFHKPHIKHGYFNVQVKRGMCLVNPDADLPNAGRRMRGFFEYWLSHWRQLFETVPTEQIMLEEAYKADCFVYAGHGSGLQYITAKVVCRTRVLGVVFLFGCESTRLNGSGLYSALYGAHNYYHGAFCPTVVGTLMPALDANMDSVSVGVLSRWLSPASQQIMPWSHIDHAAWTSKGEIKAAQAGEAPTLEQHPDYQLGSLCAVLSRVQQGLVEPKMYNCCVYVCRGLPAWNLAVQKLPF